ncbi:unnamed protein product [Rotaria socialis]|uniref:Kinesin light chain n=1 Tax=Rotaria socialis TaxID=392032 RepID=A0A820SJX5_9BILA|nr:unnamed protein product [Rotaria socialis]
MKEEIDGGGWYRMGQLIPRMGYFDQAEELYNELLENSSDDSERANVYNLLGWVKRDQGQYKEAVLFYGKSLEIYQKPLPDDHLSLGTMCSNIGQVYYMMSDYSKALEYYEKLLKIREKALPPTHLNLTDTYLNFSACYENWATMQQHLSWYGSVYRDLKEYSKALDYFEKCLTIVRKTLPENHPDFGLTYSNIGDIHHLMGDYEKALAFHRKALNIQEKKGLKVRKEKLAQKHPDLAVIYHNMSKLHFSTQQYSMAMKYVQQAVEIGQEKLTSTHPHLLEYRETFEKIRKKQ